MLSGIFSKKHAKDKKDKNQESVKPSTRSNTSAVIQPQAALTSPTQKSMPNLLSLSEHMGHVIRLSMQLYGFSVKLIRQEEIQDEIRSAHKKSYYDIDTSRLNCSDIIKIYYENQVDLELAILHDKVLLHEKEHERLQAQLAAIHFDKPIRININLDEHSKKPSTRNQQSGQHQNNPQKNNNAAIERNYDINLENFEVRIIELLQELKLWVEESKNDAFTLSVKKFIENEISIIQGRLGPIKSIAELHPAYASVLVNLSSAHQHLLPMLELITTEKTPYEIATDLTLNEFEETELQTFTTTLDAARNYLQDMKNKGLQEKVDIQKLHTYISALKNIITTRQVNLECPQELSANKVYKEISDLAKVTHQMICGIIELADLMCRDILEHPYYNISNAIKSLESELAKYNKTMEEIKTIQRLPKPGFTQSNSAIQQNMKTFGSTAETNTMVIQAKQKELPTNASDSTSSHSPTKDKSTSAGMGRFSSGRF